MTDASKIWTVLAWCCLAAAVWLNAATIALVALAFAVMALACLRLFDRKTR